MDTQAAVKGKKGKERPLTLADLYQKKGQGKRAIPAFHILLGSVKATSPLLSTGK
ncbi:MAG: hypothetical protein FWG62_04005 [Proteobacteria bacterium]|nr:hypothetical protein [Pseudomonadota bacterium]